MVFTKIELSPQISRVLTCFDHVLTFWDPGRSLPSDAVTASTLMSALGKTGRWRSVLEMTGSCGNEGSRLVLKHGGEAKIWAVLGKMGFMMDYMDL